MAQKSSGMDAAAAPNESGRGAAAIMPIVVASMFAAGAASASAEDHRLSFLESMNYVTGMNDLGQVVGSTPVGDASHAALWSDGQTLDLGTLGTLNARATAINNAGQIVGIVFPASTVDNAQAVSWTNGRIGLLGTATGQLYSQAWAVNRSGQIAGATGATLFDETATVWNHGVPMLVGDAKANSQLTDINDLGQMAGYSTSPNFGLQPTRWTAGVPTLLGTLPRTELVSGNLAMNASGQIVGTSSVQAANPRLSIDVPTLWRGNTALQLALPAGSQGGAYDINDAGQVVGWSDSGQSSQATLWDGTKTIDLNTLVDPSIRKSGWVLADATAINNRGWVAGDAVNTLTGQRAGYRLSVSAVPEPQSAALMLLSLGVIGVMSRRRKRSMD